ncbi:MULTISPECIES: twin-arginine translocase subunit TatC [Alkalimonas]|uniref:Sec-independent protein translocase protein TatC n=1 Tax=Alkalimonas mucilaginosa TaxID=3057676 RepID=A0ABU7JJN3_9GAMM|nr:twin-arginine translocase subunit TatC [Alkalimonas sp. MEB004]MEE2025163.1 twin-arginine translocase subunit TatC [Alkalimonas sp. MEB004]
MKNDALDLSRAPLLSHLLELRSRLLLCLGLFVLTFIGCYLVSEHIYNFLLQPLVNSFDDLNDRRMIFTGLHEAFITQLKVALFAATLCTLPLALLQLWRFLAPALYQHERLSMLMLLLSTPVLFLAGAALAYYLVFPLAWEFFLSFETPATEQRIAVQLEARVSEYLSLVMRLVLAFGISFELPILLFLLAKTGIVSAKSLAENRRYAVVATFAVAAIITPPDLISQIALGTPVLLLYELSIVLIRLEQRRQESLQRKTSTSHNSHTS